MNTMRGWNVDGTMKSAVATTFISLTLCSCVNVINGARGVKGDRYRCGDDKEAYFYEEERVAVCIPSNTFKLVMCAERLGIQQRNMTEENYAGVAVDTSAGGGSVEGGKKKDKSESYGGPGEVDRARAEALRNCMALLDTEQGAWEIEPIMMELEDDTMIYHSNDDAEKIQLGDLLVRVTKAGRYIIDAEVVIKAESRQDWSNDTISIALMPGGMAMPYKALSHNRQIGGSSPQVFQISVEVDLEEGDSVTLEIGRNSKDEPPVDIVALEKRTFLRARMVKAASRIVSD